MLNTIDVYGYPRKQLYQYICMLKVVDLVLQHLVISFSVTMLRDTILQTKTSKKEIKSALEIFQRELRGSNDNTSGGGGAGGGNNSSGTQRAQPQGRFAPVPPPGVQNMAALYLKVRKL